MNAAIDNRTMLLASGCTYVLLPLSIWLILKWPRQWPAVLWCMGNIVSGLGLVLMGLRERIDDILSYVVGQPLVALGALLAAQGLRLDLGRPWAWRWIVAFGSVYIVLLFVLLPLDNASLMGVVIRAFNLGAVMALATSAWQLGQAQSSRNAKTIAWAYGVQGMGVAANLVNSWMGFENIDTLQGNQMTVAVSSLILMVAFVAAMGYLGLALERSIQLNVAVAADMALAEKWNTKRQLLVTLDRSRTMSVLAGSLGHAIAQPLTSALLRVQTLVHAVKQDLALPSVMLLNVMNQGVSDLQRAIETIERIRQYVRPWPSQHARIDLDRVLYDVHKLLSQEAINRGVQLTFDHEDQPIWVVGDALLISHALMQIVRNAMAAVAAASVRKISISTRRDLKQVRIEVQDTGHGFSHDALAKPYNLQNMTNTSLQGIGLFVVNGIAKQHHGHLLIENHPHGGARVSFVLPLPTPDNKHRHAQIETVQ